MNDAEKNALIKKIMAVAKKSGFRIKRMMLGYLFWIAK